MEPLVIVPSRRRLGAELLKTLGLCAAAVFAIVRGELAVLAWSTLPYFAFAIFSLARQCLDPRPRIVIDDRGIYDRTWGIGIVAWDDIAGVSHRRRCGHSFFAFRLRDPVQYVRRLPPLSQWLWRVCRRQAGGDCLLPLGGTEADPRQVLGRLARELAARSGTPAGPAPSPPDRPRGAANPR